VKDDINFSNNINNNIAKGFPSSIEPSTPQNVSSDLAKQEALNVDDAAFEYDETDLIDSYSDEL
jgi:hypothetical protein